MTDEFTFIAEAEEANPAELMGKHAKIEPPFVRHVNSADRKELIKWVMKSADVVILGVPAPDLVRACWHEGILVFRYSERPFKDETPVYKRIVRALRWMTWNPPGALVYLLCAGAYTAGDYERIGMFRGRTVKWGYFSEFKRNKSIEKLMEEKNRAAILWAGRFLDWKHPETALHLADGLAKRGFHFQLKLIGSGPMKSELEELRRTLDIEEYVEIQEMVSPDELRNVMEHSGIFLMTSDRHEGWGAVVNEAMSCGCAVIGSSQAGSVPFLIKHGINGYLYRYGEQMELLEAAAELLEDPNKQRTIGESACRTIETEWNAEEAAARFIKMADSILKGRGLIEYADGPCSRASAIPED